MWGNIFSVLFLTHVFLRQSALCLNFEAALDQGMFEAVVRDQVSVKLDYADTPSKAMMVLGKEAFPGTSPKKYQVNISIDDNLCASPPESYDYEMSLTILKYEKGTTRIIAPDPDSDPGSNGRLDSDSGSTRLDVYVNDGQYVTWSYEDLDDRPDPYAEHLAENQAVFRTWTLKYTSGCDHSTTALGHSHACQKNLRLELSNWTPGSSLYFVSTLHKRRLMDCVLNEDAYSNGCPNQPARDFACNVDSFPLCIPYDKLTCNLLPNCAQNKIPNDDEKCSEGWNFAEALRFIIYTLLGISLLLIVTGCIRTCVNRSRSRNGAGAGDLGDARPGGEDGVSEAEYGAGAIPRRPANAPPTYDDAVKPRQHQNYGFLPDELPPSYTEVDFGVSEVASAAAATSAAATSSSAASTETAARGGPNGAAVGPDAFSPQPRPALSGWQLPQTTSSGVPPAQNPIWYIGDQSAGEATAWLNTTAPTVATSSAGPAPAVTQVGLSGVELSGDELSGAASATSRHVSSSAAAQDQTNGAQRREQQPGAAATVQDDVSTIQGPTPATNSNQDSAGVLDALQRLGLIGRPNPAGES